MVARGANIFDDEGLGGDEIVVAYLAPMENCRCESKEVAATDTNFATDGGVAGEKAMIADEGVVADRGVGPENIVVADSCPGFENCSWHDDVIGSYGAVLCDIGRRCDDVHH